MRRGRRIRPQFGFEVGQDRGRSGGPDGDAVAVVAHPTAHAEARRQPRDKRPETDALYGAGEEDEAVGFIFRGVGYLLCVARA